MAETLTKRIVADIPDDLWQRVKSLLDKKGMTLVGLLKILLIEWLDREEPAP